MVPRPGQERLDRRLRAAHHLGDLGVAHVLELVEQDGHLLVLAQDVERLADHLRQLDLAHLGRGRPLAGQDALLGGPDRLRARAVAAAAMATIGFRPLPRRWFSARLLAIVNSQVENFARGR